MIPLLLNYLMWVWQDWMDYKKKITTFSFTSPKTKYTLSSKTPQLGRTVEWLNINKGQYKRNNQLPKII